MVQAHLYRIPKLQEPRQQVPGNLVDILQCPLRCLVFDQYDSGMLVLAECIVKPTYAGVAVGLPAFLPVAPNAVESNNTFDEINEQKNNIRCADTV